MSLIELRQIEKVYGLGPQQHHVLQNINLHIEQGEMVSIMGASGSGKSTLMHIMGLLDKPSSGAYFFKDTAIEERSEDGLATLRNQTMGFVFQQFYLLARLTVLDNVALPLSYRKVSQAESRDKARALLERVGLGDKLYHTPNQLSGGQQQRVSIARALVGAPEVLFADEPTGALDSVTSTEIMNFFQELNQKDGMTIVIVTHDAEIASRSERTIVIRDGRLL